MRNAKIDIEAVAQACRLSDFGLSAKFGSKLDTISIPWSGFKNNPLIFPGAL